MDWSNIFVLLGSLILLFCVGLGPTLFLIPRTSARRVAYALCLSPTVGMIIIGLLLLAMVIQFDVAIKDVATPLAISALLISAILSFWDFRTHRNEYSQIVSRKVLAIVVACFIITVILLLLPSQANGKQYQFWQANPWDATNYTIMGWYAQNYSLSQINNPPDHAEIIRMSPYLLHPDTIGRPVVSYVLAWLSSLFDVTVYNFYYYYKLLLILLAFLVSLVLSRQLKMNHYYGLALAMVMTLGFWTQYVNDSDALSQLSIISISLLFLFAWINSERNNPDNLISRERLFLGITLAGIINFYPEMLPMLVLTVGVYYLLRLTETPTLIQVIRPIKHIATISFAVLLQIPSISSTLIYLR
jgi:hypothetical protein